MSFLLVVFYASPKALGAGMLTALTNRLGDAIILIRIALVVELNRHLEFVRFFRQPVACFSLMVAAITKRAQFPFSAWLPAAMEAPTPVSALVHSSTLVTAGVYLIIRLYDLLSQREVLNSRILIVGAVTRMFAGMRAIVEYDIKKIIALSTLSQLGLIIMRLGLGYPKLALFHLITHAMFKALLLICAGILIHFHGHAQDIRQMGGIRHQFPLTRRAIGVSKFALCALPLISGLYSKDAILEVLLWSPYRGVATCVAIIATALTGIYSARFFVGVVFPVQKGVRVVRLSEPIVTPMANLAVGAVVRGSLIVRLAGPLAMESFNPRAKGFLIFLMVVSPLIVIVAYDRGNVSKAPKKVLLFSARSAILFLRHLSTQGVLSVSVSVIRSIAKIDQSWLEVGQIEFVRPKRSALFPAIIIRSFFVLGAVVVVRVMIGG